MVTVRRVVLLLLLALLMSTSTAEPVKADACFNYQPILEGAAKITATLTAGCHWAPFAGAHQPDPGGPNQLNVGVRVPGSARVVRVAYMRILPASGRCRASASQGSTRPLGPRPLSGPGSIGITSVPIKRGLFPTPGVIRVCLWTWKVGARPTARDLRPSRRVEPFSTTVQLYGDLFGAAAALHGSMAPPQGSGTFDTPGTFSFNSRATFPFNTVHASYLDPGCGPPMIDASLSGYYFAPNGDALFHGKGQNYIGGISELCDDNVVTFSHLDGSALGSISFDSSVTKTVPASILHAGACELSTGTTNRTPDEAAQYLLAVGCVPGSVVTSPYAIGGADGSVVRFHVDGAHAQLAPLGTRVDMVVKAPSGDGSQPARAGRVMTWNIQGKLQRVGDNLGKWAREIARVRPDVIALQETCHKTSATLLTRRLRDYGLNYHSVSGPAPLRVFPHINVNCGPLSAIIGKRGLDRLRALRRSRGSNTVLSLTSITGYKNTSLGNTCHKRRPVKPEIPFITYCSKPDIVGRNVVAITTTIAGRRVRVLNAHIGNGLVSSQKKQIDKVVKQARRYPVAMILGDFNVEPGSPALASLGANGFLDVDPQATKTFRADDPKRKIDYIFLKGLRPANAVVPDTGNASDHRPLYADVG